MIIKEVAKKDYDNAMMLYCLCFQKEYKKINLNLQGNLIGLYKENDLIGLAQIDYLNNILEDKKIGYINSLCIHPNYRNKHLGSKLLEECINICKNHNCNYINLTSNSKRIVANNLYLSHDFQRINTQIFKKDL